VGTQFLYLKLGKILKLRNLNQGKLNLFKLLAGTAKKNLKCRKIINQEILWYFVVVFLCLCTL
jgi:hypothetical protein